MGLLRKFLVYTNLKSGMDDYQVVHNTIRENVIFKGTSLWVLVIAIFICCIGINMDSPGVVIGAMLISPFIGPINGMGYSMATYDFMLLKKAFRNFCFAIITALLASTSYF